MSEPTITIEMPLELGEWASQTIRATIDQQAKWRHEHLLEAHDWAKIDTHHTHTRELAEAIEAGIAHMSKEAIAA